MPRNITLTFDDGSTHVYQNAPDDVTPSQIEERAEKEFSGKKVTNIDGGRKGGSFSEQRTAPNTPSMSDVITNAAYKGAAGIPDLLLNAPTNVANLGKALYGTATAAMGRPDLSPDISETPDLARKGLTAAGLIRPDVVPQTGMQKAVDVLTQGAVGGALTGGASIPTALAGAGLGALGAGTQAGVESALPKNVPPGLREALGTTAGLLAPKGLGSLATKAVTRTPDIPEERVAAYKGMSELGGRPQGGALIFGEPNTNIKGQQTVANRIYNESVGLPKDTTFGKKELQAAKSNISAEYDRLLNGRQIHLDNQFDAELAALENEQATLSQAGKIFPEANAVLDTISSLRSGAGGAMSGDLYNKLRSQLGNDAQRAKADIDRSGLLRRMQKALDDNAQRNLPPDVSSDLGKARGQYQNLMILSDAMTGHGPGLVTPEQVGKEWANRVGQRVLYETQSPLKKLGEWGLSLSGENVNDPGTKGVGLHIPGTPIRAGLRDALRVIETPITSMRARGMSNQNVPQTIKQAEITSSIPVAAQAKTEKKKPPRDRWIAVNARANPTMTRKEIEQEYERRYGQ